MPFTFSHPAIVLPLTYLPRRWFSLTGLIIGSISPDFEYFLRMRILSLYSHTIGGIFWFDLPLGLLLAFIFHNIIRNDLFENLPIILKSRFLRFTKFKWNNYFIRNWHIVILSILLGALSHILWDNFTHKDGYFVQGFSTLTQQITILGKQVPIFKLLQHISSLLGGLVIALAIFKLPANKNVNVPIDTKYWIFLVCFTVVIITVWLLSGFSYGMYGHLIVAIISAILISLILTSLFRYILEFLSHI